jgi:tetratricopeptide (TPR) repeat protein
LFYFWYFRGHWSEGRRWLEDGVQRGDQVGPEVRAPALTSLGTLANLGGDRDRGVAWLEEALKLFRGLGDRGGSARALTSLGQDANLQRQYERATALFEEGLILFQELGDRLGAARSLGNLGRLEWSQGHVDAAIERFEETLAIFRELGDTYNVALTLRNLSDCALSKGRLAQAEVWSEASLTLSRELGTKPGIAKSLGGLVEVALRRGEYQRTRELLRQSLGLAREVEDPQMALEFIHTLATLAFAEGRAEQAVCLGGANAALSEALSVRADPEDQAEMEERLVTAREMLGEEAFSRVWERGQAMSLEDAIDYALEENG